MTPKEEAKELISQFIEPTKVPNVKGIWVEDFDAAKQCAIICAKKVLSELENLDFIKHWNEVIFEIENSKQS